VEMRDGTPHDTHDRDAATGAAARPEVRRPRRRASKTPAASRPAAQPARPVLPLAFLLEEYARDLRRGEMATKTIRNYLGVLTLAVSCWEEQLGRSPTLDDFTVRAGEAFLDHLIARGKSKAPKHAPWLATGEPLAVATLRTYTRALKVFASWLAAPKQAYTQENRLRLLKLPRKGRTYKQPLTLGEMQALISACDPTTVLGTRDLAMLLALLDGGLRVSDLIRADVGEVDTEAGQLFIASGKGRRTRQVTLGTDARRLLQRYAFLRDATAGEKAQRGDPFFQTTDGRRFKYQGVRAWLVRLKTRAGVPRVHPHLLRHTSAVRTLQVPGADLYTLQEKLGHADIATTREYLHMAEEALGERQRAFSPIDHLGLSGLMRQPSPTQAVGRLWHKRVELGPGAQISASGPQRVEARREESHEPEELGSLDSGASEPEEDAPR